MFSEEQRKALAGRVRRHEHTPGPWESRPCCYAHYTHKIIHAQKDIAQTIRSFSAKEAEANARLIAAAPDLLEACRAASTHLDDLQNEAVCETLQEIIDTLRGVIDKATGGDALEDYMAGYPKE